MLSKDTFFELQWLMAKQELKHPRTSYGGSLNQRSKSSSVIDIHTRVSGMHLGILSSNAKHISDWIDSVQIDLNTVDRWDCTTNTKALPEIGLRWNEYDIRALSDSTHAVYEFIVRNKHRDPVIFEGEYWMYDSMIDRKITNIEQLNDRSLLIISFPFMHRLEPRHDMNEILKRCCELGIPVLIDCIWLPLTNNIVKLENTQCIEVIIHSITKMLPLAGIKGGLCFIKSPVPSEMRVTEITGKVGAYVFDQYIRQKGYFYVRNSHLALQQKWCEILSVNPHELVFAGKIDNGHELSRFAWKQNGNIINLCPFYTHNDICTEYLKDKKII
jgi:hypothetical protein